MSVPPVDPADPFQLPDWIARPMIAIANSRPGRWIGINVATKLDPLLLRWSKGRVSVFAVYPNVELTVPGRRSGIPRTVTLLYFTDDGQVVLIASSFGRDRDPAWYHNVVAHPEVVLTARGESHDYVAREVTDDEEYERLFAMAVQLYPGYADYRRRTSEVGRHIPVLSLRPV